jgi:hypothetical protein
MIVKYYTKYALVSGRSNVLLLINVTVIL